MIKTKILQFLIMPLTLIFVTGCEKDSATAPLSIKTEVSAKLLLYLESEGDIINKMPVPVVSAAEVYNNIGNVLVIDLRDNAAFLEGHIAGAKNITKDSLFNYLRTIYTNYGKVVLVSSSGQSAGYYSALLRLVGFTNVYYMNFGMASWNAFFSSVWSERLNIEPDFSLFSHDVYSRRDYSNLPQINLNSPGESMKDLVIQRVDSLIKEGFNEDYNSWESNSAIKISYWGNMRNQFYTICTGPVVLYNSSPFTTNTYHLLGSVLYQVPPDHSDLRSVKYLQTLPSGSPIAVYSGTGQESAFYTAYLRFLGYNARSILFGMNNMDYYMLFRASEIISYAFTSNSIMNYPYVTGSGGK
ncbi:MAG: rhodanese-like domain-containing protein [Ignavibacteria bacterium]|nr:rhodanese-like domain-containing protein [Ignavibacteria bacterium]